MSFLAFVFAVHVISQVVGWVAPSQFGWDSTISVDRQRSSIRKHICTKHHHSIATSIDRPSIHYKQRIHSFTMQPTVPTKIKTTLQSLQSLQTRILQVCPPFPTIPHPSNKHIENQRNKQTPPTHPNNHQPPLDPATMGIHHHGREEVVGG